MLMVLREDRTRGKVKEVMGKILMWIPYDADYEQRRILLEKWYRRQAEQLLSEKAAFYAERLGVSFADIRIKDQRSRWGSCSSMGNLNYNWKLVLMPPGVLDYVVVHELAHRREMNHSAAFWKVVATWMPDYKKYRKWLRDNGNQF